MQTFLEFYLQTLCEGTQYAQRVTKSFLKIWNGHNLPNAVKQLAIEQFKVMVQALDQGGLKLANKFTDLKKLPEGGARNVYQVKLGRESGAEWRALATFDGSSFHWYWIGSRGALNTNAFITHGGEGDLPFKKMPTKRPKPLQVREDDQSDRPTSG